MEHVSCSRTAGNVRVVTGGRVQIVLLPWRLNVKTTMTKMAVTRDIFFFLKIINKIYNFHYIYLHSLSKGPLNGIVSFLSIGECWSILNF